MANLAYWSNNKYILIYVTNNMHNYVCISMESHIDTHKYTSVYATHSKYIYISTVESCHTHF